MAMKLAPPNINGTIPAFTGTTLVVPFSMNKSVGKGDVAGFAVKIKTISGKLISAMETGSGFSSSILDNLQVTFEFSDSTIFNIGQYYKIQLAYKDSDGIVGYYSTIGVVKYTEEPTIFLQNLDESAYNPNIHNYTIVYSQEDKDPTEKLYSVNFYVYNENDELIIDSGEIIHNITNDDLNYESTETYYINRDFPYGCIYKIKAKIITNNGLELYTSVYNILQSTVEECDIGGRFIAENNYDDGYIKLYLSDIDSNNLISGKYIISRAKVSSVYEWEKIKTIVCYRTDPSVFIYKDFTIEQGVSYRYSIQKVNKYDIVTDRFESNEVYADFEDMFLTDGNKQLKIRFNPKISSFKTDILEQKIDTMGSKYPFIVRNGYVNYKEFSISGLISYMTDENNYFSSLNTPDAIRTSTNANFNGDTNFNTNLSSENIYKERTFKLEVLDWLNNGEAKLCRMPTEGNYLVRLMNTSLTPNDTLGRMLHTFFSTAYEIGDISIDTLNSFGIINLKEEYNLVYNYNYISAVKGTYDLSDYSIKYIKFSNFESGDYFILNGKKFTIGLSGNYYYLNDNDESIIIELSGDSINGIVEYCYTILDNDIFGGTDFDKIENIISTKEIVSFSNVSEDINTIALAALGITSNNISVASVDFIRFTNNNEEKTTETIKIDNTLISLENLSYTIKAGIKPTTKITITDKISAIMYCVLKTITYKED